MNVLAGLCLLVIPFAASGSERLDHRGAVGLLFGAGAGNQTHFASGAPAELGNLALVDLGASLALGAGGNELLAFARAGLGGTKVTWSAVAGYRGYFGYERLKTFLDLGLSLQLSPAFTAGPRLGGGVQYELSSLAGLYAGFALQLGFGQGLLFSAELTAGLQLRSYLLESFF